LAKKGKKEEKKNILPTTIGTIALSRGPVSSLAHHSHIKVIDMFFYRPLTSL